MPFFGASYGLIPRNINMASAQSLESDKFSNVSKDFSFSNILIWFSLFCWAVTCFRYNLTSSFKFWLHDFQLSKSKSSLTVNFSLHVVWSVVLCSLTYVVFVVVFITCFSWSRVRYLKFNYPLVEYIILLVPHGSEKTCSILRIDIINNNATLCRCCERRIYWPMRLYGNL